MLSRPQARPASLLTMILFCLPLLVHPASAATYLVRPDGTGDFATIQEAIGASSDGDVIRLADGEYLGDGNSPVMFLGKAITVESVSNDPARCGLSAVLFLWGEGRESVLRGVRVVWDYSTSANVLCWDASPTFDNCSFENCLDSGGVVVDPGAPLFRNCRFTGNSVGIWLHAQAGDPVIEDCTFIGNQRGISATGGTVARCWFEGNDAGTGAAVTIHDGAMSFRDCTFVGNHATSGGAIYVSEYSGCHLTRCTFYGNSATNLGSAVLSVDHSDVTLDNCVVAANTGSAAVACNPLGQLNTPVLACCNLYGNPTGDWTGCIADQLPLRGNLGTNPFFCGPADHDFTVRSDSPCAPDNPLCGQIGAWGTGCEPPTEVGSTPGAPSALSARVSPNPFATTTSIAYSIPASVDAPISLRIHDAQGRLVRELAHGAVIAGSHLVSWDGRDEQGKPVAAGTYFYRMEWNGEKAAGMLIRVR